MATHTPIAIPSAASARAQPAIVATVTVDACTTGHREYSDIVNPRASATRTGSGRALIPGSGDHAAIYANFLDAIQHGAQLVADGEEGRLSLELANALIYSSHTDQHVSLPLDRAAYAALLEELRSGASPGQPSASLLA